LIALILAVSASSCVIAADIPTPRILVEHEPSGFMGDHASYIATAISNAKDVHGIVEFEAGKVYRTSQVNVWRDSGGGDDTRYMIAGIEGNGAVLKWVEDGDVGSGQSLIYLWAPEFKGNTGFFIRNLTLDCGNNNIPTYNDRDDDDEGLNGDGSKGDLAYGDEACDYGLRIWGGEDFLIENVSVLRAAKWGVYVQTNQSYAVRNAVFRQVMSRYCQDSGWQFENTAASPVIQIQNITLENCYSHRNQKHGCYFEHADNIRMVGCGAEKNKSENIYADESVGTFDWLGGSTEKGNFDSLAGANGSFVGSPPDVDKCMKFEDGAGPVRILGARLFGRLIYDTSAGKDFLVHSNGHTKTGFDGSNVPTNNTISPIAANYTPTAEQTLLRDKVAPCYYEVPDYMRFRKGMSVFGTTCTTKQQWQAALEDKLNIFVVLHSWDPNLGTPGPPADLGDQTANIQGRVTDALNASGTYSGALAFEPGVVYETKPIVVQGQFGSSGAGIMGIIGNGATLTAISGGTTTDPLLKLELVHGSQDPENDHYNFWMTDLVLDANELYDTGLQVTKSKYFHLRNLDISNAVHRGVLCDAEYQSDVYYGMFQNVVTHHNGQSIGNGNGFELSADTVDTWSMSIGIANANVGYYRCHSHTNNRVGLAVDYASVTFVDCVFDNNRTYDAEMSQTRSVDLINCDLRAGFSGTVGLRINNIGVAYYGVHLLGGRLRNRLNLATSAGAGSVTYGAGVSHSMVRTEYDPNLPTAQSASFLYNIAGDGSGTNVAEGNGSYVRLAIGSDQLV
jgi:hypothetical protein